jgi:hypothetical protein
MMCVRDEFDPARNPRNVLYISHPMNDRTKSLIM